jgi:hypothetical protein
MLCYLIKPSTMTAEDMETPECMKRIQVQVCEQAQRQLHIIPRVCTHCILCKDGSFLSDKS